jgi:hypothetical protein
MVVNDPGPFLGEHPEVVPKDIASENVNWVVSASEKQHESYRDKRQKSRVLELVVALFSELEEVDYTKC